MKTYNDDDSASGTGANMTSTSYDGNGQLVSETSTPEGGSAQTENFVYGEGGMLMDSNYAWIMGPDGSPLEQVTQSTQGQQFLSTDADGSVRGVIGSGGSVTNTTTYDPYGNQPSAVIINATWASSVATITTASANGFTTGESITIQGVTPSGYDGTHTITSTGSTTFTFSLTTNPGGYSSGGSGSSVAAVGAPLIFGADYALPDGQSLSGNEILDDSTDIMLGRTEPSASKGGRCNFHGRKTSWTICLPLKGRHKVWQAWLSEMEKNRPAAKEQPGQYHYNLHVEHAGGGADTFNFHCYYCGDSSVNSTHNDLSYWGASESVWNRGPYEGHAPAGAGLLSAVDASHGLADNMVHNSALGTELDHSSSSENSSNFIHSLTEGTMTSGQKYPLGRALDTLLKHGSARYEPPCSQIILRGV